MAWHYSATPDQVQPELGLNLLDGDPSAANPEWTGTGPWSREGGGGLALTVGDPHLYLTLTPDAVYTATVEVRGADTVSWRMTLQNAEQEQVEIPIGDVDATPTDDWVTVRADWRAPLDPLTGSPAVTATGPGTVEIRNPVMAVQTGRVILTVPGDVLAERIMASGGIVAGTPDGARVELTQDGLAAYDATSTQTAHIAGEGGEFVGGSFRTSDTLPGQVVLADDALSTNIGTTTGPGIRVVPKDATGFEYMPGIGPSTAGLMIYGGKRAGTGASIVQANPGAAFLRTFREGGAKAGEMQTSPTASYMRTYREDGTTGGEMQTSPTLSYMRTYREDGATGGQVEVDAVSSRIRTYSGNSTESGWVQVRPQDVELAYVAPDNTYFSRIKADASEAFLYTRAGGTSRYLSVDANGVWVKTNKSGSWESWNLEETASDSGWIDMTVLPGFAANQGNVPQVRRQGSSVTMRRGVDSTGLSANGSFEVLSFPPELAPDEWKYIPIAGSSVAATGMAVITSTGRVTLRTGSTLSPYYLFDAVRWDVD